MKVLITGGCGFVGRAFTEHYLRAGCEVHCVDNLISDSALRPDEWDFNVDRYASRFHYWEMDCRTWFGYSNYPKFDYVLHLAAVVGGRLKIENEPIAVADDLSIDAAFWQWAVRAKPDKVAVFSSSAVYPVAWQTRGVHPLLTEAAADMDDTVMGRPDMSYGWAKLTCEYLAKLACQKHGIRSVVYRPFSGYGVGQHGTYPFPAIMKRVLLASDDDDVGVWGSGEQVRDFIHISDIVRAVDSTIDRIGDASALNLSTGIGTSFIQLAMTAADVLGKRVRVVPNPDKPEGVFWRVGDTGRQQQFGVQHEVPLRKGIEGYLAWLSSRRP